MKKWEYKIINIKRLSDVSELNELGNDGWELVNVISGETFCGFRAIFKREIIK